MRSISCIAVATLAACITPPAVMEGGTSRLDLLGFPPATVPLEIDVGDRTRLRGVFVPGDDGAPVVVHFLESGCSITQGSRAFPSLEAIWELRDLGFASLALDYRGVGASDGSRSPEHIEDDAAAAWGEALRRTDGRAGRIVLRGISLGTIAAASLLESGVRPGGVILIAPVRAETVARRYTATKLPPGLGDLVGLVFRRASDVDVLACVSESSLPLVAVWGTADELLGDGERTLFRHAVRASRGRTQAIEGRDHWDVALEGHRLFEIERQLVAELFPDLPSAPSRVAAALAGVPAAERTRIEQSAPERARLERLVRRWRLDPPRLSAAMARHAEYDDETTCELAVEWLRRAPIGALEAMPFDALDRLVDLSDPAGALDARELLPLDRLVAAAAAASQRPPTAGELARRALDLRLHERALYEPLPASARPYAELYETEKDADRREPPLPEDTPARLQLVREDSLRQATRLLLKAAFVPERVATSATGETTVEAWERGEWRAVASRPFPSGPLQ